MLIISKHKQSARIKCKNNLFKPCVRSKQLRTIKTIICKDIFTSLRRKKVQSPAKQFKELFSLGPNHFRRGLTMFVFSFRRWIARAKCQAGMARNFRFPWQFPSLNTTSSKLTTKKQCFLQCFRCLSCFSAAVAKENLHSPANFQILLRHLRLAFDWLSVSFFDY